MRLLLTPIFTLFCALTASAQIFTTTTEELRMAKTIRDDFQMERYVWAIGTGSDIESADQSALRTLAQNAMVQTTVMENSIKNVSTGSSAESSVSTSAASVGVSNIYMENVTRIILPDQNGEKVVLRYMTRENWDRRDEQLRNKIESYIEAAQYSAASPEEMLKYYSWAAALLTSYTKEDITVDGIGARQALQSKISETLGKIDVKVIGIEENKSNKNYPYKLFLDFIYGSEPLPSITFSYFDGSGTVDGECVKDGRSVIQMKKLPETFNVTIDCVMEDLARQIEPSVAVLIPQLPVFKEGIKQVVSQPKGVKARAEFDSNSEKVNSVVAEQLKEVRSDYAEVKEVDQSEPYQNILTDIVSSFSSLSAVNIRPHFTDNAWEEYQRIVAEGNPTLARTPNWTFAELDSLVICREMPIKLKFKGNKSFVEDVVFRINKNTKKIESLAYKLSTSTEKHIMATRWNDHDRLTLITFLEDYRTAYCLRDLGYIQKVFSDDAYIIVGKVLQQSNKKYSDKTELIDQNGKVVYTQYSKSEYLKNLQKSFLSKEFVNIRFEECNVCKGNNAKEGIYAVQVRQLYYSNNYADEGILTLAIDMRDNINPLVRVRVWQQERDVTYDAEQMIERTVSTEGSISAN